MEYKIIDDSLIIEIKTDMNIDFDLTQKQDLKERAFKTNKNIILDMTECRFVNSSGLGVLIDIQKNQTKKKFDFKVVTNNKQILDVFNMTNLTKFLKIYSSMENALSV